jgi:rfaE bifunctional protein nucleotidyltransferase chain/domain
MTDKLVNIEELKKAILEYRSKGKKIATTNGSFDLLHIGHIYMLESAKRLTDILILLINSDKSIKKLKGDKRPIVSELERAAMLSALEAVDYVYIFDDDNPIDVIKEIKPDLHIKGGTFEPERVRTEKEIVESWGGRHITLPLVGGYSTTNLIDKILKSYKLSKD